MLPPACLDLPQNLVKEFKLMFTQGANRGTLTACAANQLILGEGNQEGGISGTKEGRIALWRSQFCPSQEELLPASKWDSRSPTRDFGLSEEPTSHQHKGAPRLLKAEAQT